MFLGGYTLNQPEPIQPVYPMLGIPAWAIPWIGWAEILIGGMLAYGPAQKLGSWGLTIWMLGALTASLRAGDWAAAGLSLALLLLGAAAVWSWRRRPVDKWALVPAPLRRVPTKGVAVIVFLFQMTGLVFLVRWAIGGTLFWLCLPVLAWGHANREATRSDLRFLHLLLLYLLVLGLGVGGLWNFVGHFLMSDTVAESIGWPTGSPFQHELAFYHLGMGTVGILCLWWRDRFWIAAGLAPGIFAYGAGLVHIREFLREGNVNPGNWSFAVVGGNLLIPTAILALLFLYARKGGFDARAEPTGS